MDKQHDDKSTILIVDDTPENLDVLVAVLKDDYRVKVASNGARALTLAGSDPHPDLILLDIMMPDMDGYEVCKRLQKEPATRTIPVIFVTALSDVDDEAKGLALGAVDYITKPIIPNLLKARVHTHLELKRHRDHLQELVDERTIELKRAREATVEAMGIVAEGRDPETGGHIHRTKLYVKVLAEELARLPGYEKELTPEKVEQMYYSAPLHDIGKVAISDLILLKPGKLSDEEFAIMKQHATIGEETIKNAQQRLGGAVLLDTAKEIAGGHHEKWDGSGYPKGRSGNDIPLSARLMALADVYDALISRRTYKEPIDHTKAVEIIKEQRGKHFDPAVVDIFLQHEQRFREIAEQYSSK